MKRFFKNKAGMTLVEVLLAVTIFVIMIWAFAPFIASTFKQIAQAGALHIEIAEDVSIMDGMIANEFFGASATFPVKLDSDANIDVSGVHLESGKLHTFFSDNLSYISTDSILYEGYGNNGLYNSFYSIGFLPEVTDKKFFKNDHTYVVKLLGSDNFEYIIDEEIDTLKDPKNDIDPTSVDYMAGVFFVPSSLPDSGVGEDPDGTQNDGNPDKVGYLMIVPDTLGLDNSNSPYTLTIETKDTGQSFLENPVVFHVELPLYQAVGAQGYERIASHINYWVDKYSYEDTDYGTSGIDINRLPYGITFNDVIWHQDDTQARYYTVGNYSTTKEDFMTYNWNLWYRENETEWTQLNITGGIATSPNLNRIKRIGDKFLVIGSSGTVLVSSDGDTWENKSIPSSTHNLTAVASDGTNYVFLAEDGSRIYSPVSSGFSTYYINDKVGAGFAADSSESIIINDMIYTSGYFIAVGENKLIATSENGIFWSTIDTPVKLPSSAGSFNCVYDYMGKGFILGEKGQIFGFGMTGEPDYWTWTEVQGHNVDSADYYDMTYSRKAFVIVGSDGTVMYSLNGSTWNDCTTMVGFNTDYTIYAVAGRE